MSTDPTTLLVIFGTRPEAIKLSPLILALRASAGMRVHVHCTGQHGEWLTEILEWFGVEPNTRGTLPQAHTLTQSFEHILRQTSALMERVRPDAVVVQGDTTSAFASSLAAFYTRCPVVHVEAGLRTGDLEHPWPEEAHRRALTLFSTYHLAPTAHNVSALISEGISPERIALVGNTVIDALKWTQAKLASTSTRPLELDVVRPGRPWVVVTLHRRENFQDATRREMIFDALARAARAHPHLDWLLPVHANPEVAQAQHAGTKDIATLRLIDAQPYPDFVRLLDGARGIVTDSGGIQEEAQALGTPTVVVRRVTERHELIEQGGGRLAYDADTLEHAIQQMLTQPPAAAAYPYGEGDASARCLDALTRWFGDGD